MKFRLLLLFMGLLSAGIHAQQKVAIASARISFAFPSKNDTGTIADFKSTSTIDLENLSESTFKGSVAVATIKTGNFIRDWSLKSGRYFNEDDYPRIYFKGTNNTLIDNKLQVKGALTIKSTTKSVTFEFYKKGNLLIGTTSIYSSDFGISIKDQREDNKVDVKIELTLDK